MTDISILDLQNLRHLIGGYSTTQCKMQDYASQAEDPEVKQLFQQAAAEPFPKAAQHSAANEQKEPAFLQFMAKPCAENQKDAIANTHRPGENTAVDKLAAVQRGHHGFQNPA